jgi:hypothetical protein
VIRKTLDTPLFRARCNSMLAYIALHGRVSDWVVEDEDVIRHLMYQNKIRYASTGNLLVVVPGATRYANDGTDGNPQPHPMVLELAAENPMNEHHVAVFRKNRDYCTLTLAA